jgi:hypothetical protein
VIAYPIVGDVLESFRFGIAGSTERFRIEILGRLSRFLRAHIGETTERRCAGFPALFAVFVGDLHVVQHTPRFLTAVIDAKDQAAITALHAVEIIDGAERSSLVVTAYRWRFDFAYCCLCEVYARHLVPRL